MYLQICVAMYRSVLQHGFLLGRGEFLVRGMFHVSEKFNGDTMTGHNIMALR